MVEPLLDGALRRALDAASGRHGLLVLVGGEAGVGKSSLVRALGSRLEGRAAFVVGACEPLSVPAPLAPIRELLSASGADSAGVSDTGDRLALAWSLLQGLAGREPVVAVIEDAHWADPATLDVVRLLACRVEGVGAVVVVTYRDDELAANAALMALVGDHGQVEDPFGHRWNVAQHLRRAARGGRGGRRPGLCLRCATGCWDVAPAPGASGTRTAPSSHAPTMRVAPSGGGP